MLLQATASNLVSTTGHKSLLLKAPKPFVFTWPLTPVPNSDGEEKILQ